jgi:hypothetical protein
MNARMLLNPLEKTMKIKFLAICSILIFTGQPAFGKDLYVATIGNDSVSYSENSISSPWRSLGHAIYSLSAGDTLHIRSGTYTPHYPLLVRSDYANRTYGGDPSLTMMAESGTLDAPVIIQSYEGEDVVVDLQNSNSPTFIVIDNKNNWTFKDFSVINAGSAFVVGLQAAATGIIFDGLEIRSVVGGDNSANIKINSGDAENITIKNSTLIGPGLAPDIHLNTAVIYARRLRQLDISNNHISNAPIGIYYKHRPEDGIENISIKIEKNIIDNTSRASAQLETVKATISNNIITPNNAPFNLNNAAGAPGGDYNYLTHNTFGVSVNLRWDTQDGDPTPGAIGNTLENNIFLSELYMHWYSDIPHKTTSDFNLYASEFATGENRKQYRLNEWQYHARLDYNSIEGKPVFSGFLDSNPEHYRLLNSSPGYRAANDKTDIGVDPSEVGPGERYAAEMASPKPPSVITVQ